MSRSYAHPPERVDVCLDSYNLTASLLTPASGLSMYLTMDGTADLSFSEASRNMISDWISGYFVLSSSIIHGPAGLDIGAEMPESIALAIVAEIHAFLNRRDGSMLTRTGI